MTVLKKNGSFCLEVESRLIQFGPQFYFKDLYYGYFVFHLFSKKKSGRHKFVPDC